MTHYEQQRDFDAASGADEERREKVAGSRDLLAIELSCGHVHYCDGTRDRPPAESDLLAALEGLEEAGAFRVHAGEAEPDWELCFHAVAKARAAIAKARGEP